MPGKRSYPKDLYERLKPLGDEVRDKQVEPSSWKDAQDYLDDMSDGPKGDFSATDLKQV